MIKSSPFFGDIKTDQSIRQLPDESILWTEKHWVDNYLKNKTLSELVENTFNLTGSVEAVYFHFGLRIKNVTLSDDFSKTFFKSYNLKNNLNIILKCFTISIFLNKDYEYNYFNFFASARLLLKSKINRALFYMTMNRPLTHLDPVLEHRREIVKRNVKNVIKCSNYEDKSRINFIDQCVINEILINFKQIYLSFFHLNNYRKYSNYSIYLDYEVTHGDATNCSRNYELRDCQFAYFDCEKTHFQYATSNRFHILQVVFRTISQTEHELIRYDDLHMSLCNLISILLGINVQNLMALIFKLLELRFSCRKFKKLSLKIFKLLFFFSCILMINHVCEFTFKGELNTSLLITSIPKLVRFPEINICFDINSLIPSNVSKFTGEDLEKWSKHINHNNVIEHFILITDRNQEINIKSPFNEDYPLLKLLPSFFFLNKKCLKIRYDFSWIETRNTNFKHIFRM